MGGRPWASISAPSYPGNCGVGGGGKGNDARRNPDITASSVEVSPKLCPTVTHHLEWPGCPQKNNRVGVGQRAWSIFPISARSLHIKNLTEVLQLLEIICMNMLVLEVRDILKI